MITGILKGTVQCSIISCFNIASYECEACIDDTALLRFRVEKARAVFTSDFFVGVGGKRQDTVSESVHKVPLYEVLFYFLNRRGYTIVSERNKY